MIRIAEYDPRYRDDLWFCILSAKNALGRVPHLSDDLLDIKTFYFANGDKFWIALDKEDRVVGTLGTKTVSQSDLWLKRLFVRPDKKRKGIASLLFAALENFAREKGISTLHTRFPDDFCEAAKFYPAKGFTETERSDSMRHFIKKLS